MEILDENLRQFVEKSARILGFQDCVIELLLLKEKGEDLCTVKLSGLVENYKKTLV